MKDWDAPLKTSDSPHSARQTLLLQEEKPETSTVCLCSPDSSACSPRLWLYVPCSRSQDGCHQERLFSQQHQKSRWVCPRTYRDISQALSQRSQSYLHQRPCPSSPAITAGFSMQIAKWNGRWHHRTLQAVIPVWAAGIPNENCVSHVLIKLNVVSHSQWQLHMTVNYACHTYRHTRVNIIHTRRQGSWLWAMNEQGTKTTQIIGNLASVYQRDELREFKVATLDVYNP